MHLQRWLWERVGREKLLLRCRLLGRARRFGAHGGRRGAGAYRGGRLPTVCYVCIVIAFAFGKINILLHSSFLTPSAGTQFQWEPIQRGHRIQGVEIFLRFSTEIAVCLGNGTR